MIASIILQLKKRRWLAIMPAGGVFFLYVLIQHIVPLIADIQNLRADAAENARKLDQAQDWKFAFKKLEGKKKSLLKKIDTLVVGQAGGHPSQMVLTLSRRARENGVELLTLEPGTVRKTESNTELPIRLTAKTRYHNLCRFIRTIETSEPVVRIQSLKIQSENMSSNRIWVEMDLTVYYLEKTT